MDTVGAVVGGFALTTPEVTCGVILRCSFVVARGGITILTSSMISISESSSTSSLSSRHITRSFPFPFLSPFFTIFDLDLFERLEDRRKVVIEG